MAEAILKIFPKKYDGETTIISARMTRSMLRDVDAVAEATGRSRNEILMLCIEFSLEHMEVTEKKKPEG